MKKIYIVFYILLCSSVASASTFPITLAVTASSSCALDGSIIVQPGGGMAPYTYSINAGAFQVSNTFTNLAPGIYTVVVMDMNGDTGTGNATISVAPPVTASYVSSNASCAGGDGSITMTSVGGVSPFGYSIDGGVTYQSTAVFSGLNAGTYMILVQDATSCSITIQAEVLLTNNIVVSAGPDVTACYGTGIQLTGTGSGGGTYSWSPAATLSNPNLANPFANPVASTLYTLSFSVGPCMVTDDVLVIVDNPSVSAGNDTSVCSGNSVILNASGSAILAGLWTPSFGLSNPAILNPVATPASTISYIFTGTDAAGCIAHDTILVQVFTLAIPLVDLNAGVLSISNPDIAVTYTWQVLGSLWEDIVPAEHGTSYTPTVNGKYRVMAAIGNCIAYSASQLAGRAASTNPYGIYLYPNPSTNRITLDAIFASQSWEMLEITNAQGTRILSQNIRNQTSVSVNIAALGRGIYSAKLSATDGKTTVIRFIKY